MKMWKLPKVSSDTIDSGEFYYIDVTTLTEATTTADTAVFAGSGWTLTFTVDGGSAPVKVANAQAIVNYLLPKMLEWNGHGIYRKEAQSIFEPFAGMTIATILSTLSITSPGTNDGLVTLAVA